MFHTDDGFSLMSKSISHYRCHPTFFSSSWENEQTISRQHQLYKKACHIYDITGFSYQRFHQVWKKSNRRCLFLQIKFQISSIYGFDVTISKLNFFQWVGEQITVSNNTTLKHSIQNIRFYFKCFGWYEIKLVTFNI